MLRMSVTIYHNPACGTSRNTLAMIRATGAEPEIVEYLRQPPTRSELASLIDRMEIAPRALLRPIVVGPNGAKLCRPAEQVLSILDRPLRADFVKEDGATVRANG